MNCSELSVMHVVIILIGKENKDQLLNLLTRLEEACIYVIPDSETILLYYIENWDGHENWSAPRPHQDK